MQLAKLSSFYGNSVATSNRRMEERILQSDRLRLVMTSVEVVVAAVLLFTGSALLYAALYGIIFAYGNVQLISAVMTWGIILIVLGVITAWDVGRKLKAKHQVVIALADLFGSFVLVFLILSSSPDSVLAWLAISGINNVLLDIAFAAGYVKSNLRK